jgi:hypothetical protein
MSRPVARLLLLTVLGLALGVPSPAHAFDIRCGAALPALEATAKGLKVSLAATKASLPTLKRKAADASAAAKLAQSQATNLRILSEGAPNDESLRQRARDAKVKVSSLKALATTSVRTLKETEKRLPGLQAKLASATQKIAAERLRCNKG